MGTLLHRMGNKQRIAKLIIPHMPSDYNVWIEPFWGAGGMHNSITPAKFEFVNDIDSEVFNLYTVVKEQREDLISLVRQTPVNEDLRDYWVHNTETDPLYRAMRLLFINNYLMYSNGHGSLSGSPSNAKSLILERIDAFYQRTFKTVFFSRGYKEFLNALTNRTYAENRAFIYCDPPYVGTRRDAYKDSEDFTKEDFFDLIETCISKKCKFMVSEFLSPHVEEASERYNLKLTIIRKQYNLSKESTEIILTNYDTKKTLF